MEMTAGEVKNDFNDWWNSVGSGIAPMPHEDTEEFAKRVAFRAFDHANDIYND